MARKGESGRFVGMFTSRELILDLLLIYSGQNGLILMKGWEMV